MGIIIVAHFMLPDRVWDIIVSLPAYLYYSGIYMHTLVIFAFCNIDDVTWGTKGLASGDTKSPYFDDKIRFVAKWLVTNSILSYILLLFNQLLGQN